MQYTLAQDLSYYSPSNKENTDIETQKYDVLNVQTQKFEGTLDWYNNVKPF